MRAAIYARVSSQAQRDRQTIRAQLESLPGYVRAQGWTLVETYVDDGKSARSGKLEQREAFGRMLRDATARRFGVLVVVDLDRLTRADDLAEWGTIYGTLQSAGVVVATPSSGIVDLSTFLGRVLAGVKGAMAAEDNRVRIEKSMAGKLAAIRAGHKPAGPTPYGLTYSRDRRAWGIDPETAPIVREMYERVAGGESCEEVARDLEARGVPRIRKHGSAWTRHAVWRVICSTHPYGEWTADKRRGLSMPVPAIVDRDLWDRAHAVMIAQGRRGLRRTRHVYLLEGLAVCGICGARIRIASQSARAQGYRGRAAYYVCGQRWTSWGADRRCPLPLLRVDTTDADVWREIDAVLGDPAIVEAALASRVDPAEAAGAAADLSAAERQLAEHDRRAARALSDYQRGAIPDSVWEAGLDEAARRRRLLVQQVDAARRAVGIASRSVADLGDARAALEQLRQGASTATPETRQRLARALLPAGSVVAHRDRTDLGITIPLAGSGEISLAVGSGSAQQRENVTVLRVVRR